MTRMTIAAGLQDVDDRVHLLTVLAMSWTLLTVPWLRRYVGHVLCSRWRREADLQRRRQRVAGESVDQIRHFGLPCLKLASALIFRNVVDARDLGHGLQGGRELRDVLSGCGVF